jgi:hypothetical protein
MVFFCTETQKQAMFEDNVHKGKLDRFIFNKEGDFVTLTGSLFGDKDSFSPYTKLDVIDDYEGRLFARSFERSMLYYEDTGIFMYSHLDGVYIKTVFAKCTIF